MADDRCALHRIYSAVTWRLGQHGRNFAMFNTSLRNHENTRRYSIVPTDSGWEVREEQDSRLVRRVEYRDWHRVERARRSMAAEMRELEAAGWRVE